MVTETKRLHNETQTTPAPAERSSKTGSKRLAFLDYTRGIAALIMLQGHTFHAYARADLRETGTYVLSQFVGGVAPAIFLFLTGVTLAFMLDGRERKGATRKQRVSLALRRAGYLALLAFAFRFQLWLFGLPYSRILDLLKVDILNCMALGIATMAVLGALTTVERIHGGILFGVAIAAASPLISLLDPGLMPSIVHDYVAPNAFYFSYFPWAAFIGFGIAAGSILRLPGQDNMHRTMQWAAITGFGLVMVAEYFSNLPYSLYPSTDFWINSPGLVFIKLGVILILLSMAFLWTNYSSAAGWSWVQQLGTTSLLVYWVHIELVYGQWFGYWKESLTIGQCVLASTILILAMIALSRWRTSHHWPDLRFGSVAPTKQANRLIGGE
jgi:uncharacterized membrane protein